MVEEIGAQIEFVGRGLAAYIYESVDITWCMSIDLGTPCRYVVTCCLYQKGIVRLLPNRLRR